MTSRTRWLMAGLLVALAAACGDDDDGGSAGDTGVTSTAVAAGDSGVTSTAVAAGDSGVTSTAVAAGDSGVTSTAVAAGDSGVTSTAVAAGDEVDLSDVDLSDFQLAVMLPTTTEDRGWSAAMNQAAQDIGEELGIDVNIASNIFDPAQSAPVLNQFVEQGYDLIIVHSFSFEPVLREVAPQYPDQLFTMASFAEPERNLLIHTYSYLETGYSMCWLAAKLSQSGVIGMVGVDEVPFNTETHDGCRVGAEDANADVEVVETFAGDFFDLQRGREAAQTAVDQGADVLFVSGGSDSSIGALNFCEDEDLICMGVVANDHDMAPNALVTSANIDWKPFLRQWIAAAATGDLEPAVWDASFENGALFALPFEGASAEKVPNEVREEFAAMIDQLANGEIDLPESEAHPGYP